MPKKSCFIVLVTDVDTFHVSGCADAERMLGREAGMLDNCTLAEALVRWHNGLVSDKLFPQMIAFCDHCKPQLED